MILILKIKVKWNFPWVIIDTELLEGKMGLKLKLKDFSPPFRHLTFLRIKIC